MENDLRKFNLKAEEAFLRLRKKLKLDIVLAAAKRENVPVGLIDKERVEDMLNNTYPKMVEGALFEVDKTFNFIDSLKLQPNLSLAIGLIISASKTNNKSELNKAIAAITKELENGDEEKEINGN